MAIKKTLLEITQDILSIMDGDEVNSIGDTEEAYQVARSVVRTYEALVSNSNWYHTRKGLTLVPYSDSEFPTHIRLNDNVKQLTLINYNKRKVDDTRDNYEEVKWKDPDDFLRYLNLRNSGDTNITNVVDVSGIALLIQTDKQPDYFTSFDDETIVFDSYDSEVDSTIQESKVQAVGFIIPTLMLKDDAIPELPPDAWAGFIEEATKKAQWWVRQFEDPVAAQEASRQRRWLSRKQWRVNGGIKFPDYGRKR